MIRILKKVPEVFEILQVGMFQHRLTKTEAFH